MAHVALLTTGYALQESLQWLQRAITRAGPATDADASAHTWVPEVEDVCRRAFDHLVGSRTACIPWDLIEKDADALIQTLAVHGFAGALEAVLDHEASRLLRSGTYAGTWKVFIAAVQTAALSRWSLPATGGMLGLPGCKGAPVGGAPVPLQPKVAVAMARLLADGRETRIIDGVTALAGFCGGAAGAVRDACLAAMRAPASAEDPPPSRGEAHERPHRAEPLPPMLASATAFDTANLDARAAPWPFRLRSKHADAAALVTCEVLDGLPVDVAVDRLCAQVEPPVAGVDAVRSVELADTIGVLIVLLRLACSEPGDGFCVVVAAVRRLWTGRLGISLQTLVQVLLSVEGAEDDSEAACAVLDALLAPVSTEVTAAFATSTWQWVHASGASCSSGFVRRLLRLGLQLQSTQDMRLHMQPLVAHALSDADVHRVVQDGHIWQREEWRNTSALRATRARHMAAMAPTDLAAYLPEAFRAALASNNFKLAQDVLRYGMACTPEVVRELEHMARMTVPTRHVFESAHLSLLSWVDLSTDLPAAQWDGLRSAWVALVVWHEHTGHGHGGLHCAKRTGSCKRTHAGIMRDLQAMFADARLVTRAHRPFECMRLLSPAASAVARFLE
jgi:hypothetical protein